MTLDINGTDDEDMSINDASCTLMMEALMKSHAPMKQINFRFNFIGDEGAIAISKLINEKPTFEYLDLQSNEVGDVGFRDLVKAMAR